MTAVVRKETDDWRKSYRSDLLVKRRLSGHERKLRSLGLFDLPRDIALLDVCCGEGEMLDILQREGFSRLTGVDLPQDSELAASLKSKHWRYAAASATELPFSAGTFDWIICAHSLHHLAGLENISRFIKQASEALKPGGRLVLIDHYDSPQFRLALGTLLSPIGLLTPMTAVFREQHLEEKDILYRYLDDWSELKKRIMNSGFKTVSMRYGLFFFYATLLKGEGS